MTPIGTEVIRKEVIHIRPQMILVEYIATTYGCPKCKDTEEPQFVKAVPFYRLEQTFEEL